MGHKISKRDNVFLAKLKELYDGMGWHKLGKPTEIFDKATLAPTLFGHEMKQAGIMLPDGSFYGTGEFYAVAKDDGLPVGKAVGKNWFSPSNEELFDLFTSALEGSDYKICSVLTVENRQQFAIDAHYTGGTLKAGSRDFKPYVGLHRQFGGKGKLCINGHGTVIQCGNTTALFLSEVMGADDTISAKNCGNLAGKLPAIKAAIERQHGVSGMFADAMAQAESETVKTEHAALAFVGWLNDGQPLAVKSVNRANRLTELFKTGAGNRGENLADWFNAVTDFATHESAGEDKAKQFLSSEFGTARNDKAKLVRDLFDLETRSPKMDYFKGLATLGRKSVKATDDKDTVAELILS